MRKAAPLPLIALALGGCLGLGADAPAPEPRVRVGYAAEHPLPMASIPDSYAFLDRLRTPEGRPARYRRVGSFRAPDGIPAAPNGKAAILDAYEVADDTGATVRLWLNPYAGHTSPTPPDGFRLAPSK